MEGLPSGVLRWRKGSGELEMVAPYLVPAVLAAAYIDADIRGMLFGLLPGDEMHTFYILDVITTSEPVTEYSRKVMINAIPLRDFTMLHFRPSAHQNLDLTIGR
jgi:hypothetical protein